jgi:protein-S-isoprenylcysteine O-methyltransferase Ste14
MPCLTAKAREMSIFGVGPTWVAVSAVMTLAMFALTRDNPATWTFPWIPAALRVTLGVALILAGVPLFVSSLRVLKRGFPEGKLFTRGPYAMCRHPLYASWVTLIVPGMVLLNDRWPGLVVVLGMWISLRLLVRKEEAWLEQTFGDDYRHYKKQTPACAPLFWRR